MRLVPVLVVGVLLGLVPVTAEAAVSPTPTAIAAGASPTADPVPTPTPTPGPTSTPTSPAPTPTPTPTPTPSAPSSTPTPTQTPAPTPSSNGSGSATQPGSSAQDQATQRMIDQARTQISGNVADALATAQRLTDSLNLIVSERTQVEHRILAGQAKIDTLNHEIARLNAEIATTQRRIEGERAQIAILARQLYQEPNSLLLRLLQAGSVRDMVTETSDLAAAALHADALRKQLSDDLSRLDQDQAAQQRARDAETQMQAQLTDALRQFQDLAAQEQQTSNLLVGFIHDGRAALAGAATRAADLAQQVAATLQEREQQLIATAEQQVWQQEQLWATLNASAIPPPVAITVSRPDAPGSRFAWPIQGATLTQGFGPTDLWLEPAMFGFSHFHTGLDLASSKTTITAAADGVVAAVGLGTTGYGNYVIIVHRDGFVTLYGHLAVTLVSAGQMVTQGQQIGVEGSTGASTGTHLHFEVRFNGAPIDPSPYLPGRGSA